MPVEVGMELFLQNWEHVLDERNPTSHPLEVGPAPVVVRPVQPSLRKALQQPPQHGLVPNVHTERHLRLLSVATK